jgi:hypothetical protein
MGYKNSAKLGCVILKMSGGNSGGKKVVNRQVMNDVELSNEDSLRLNVLLSQKLQAVRIDESRMMLYALTDKGEASVALNPNCRDDRYLRHVRELLSTHVLGSPGGYPVYITRWTRMGQDRDNTTLHNLLLLGEPEAVAAVVHAPGLTPALAKLAWWVLPEAEHARRMLVQPQVAGSEVAHELAEFLIEYLPFETEPKAIMDSVRLVLQPGLVGEVERNKLWKRASRKGIYYVSFLQAMPDNLPELCAAHHEQVDIGSRISDLLVEGNLYAVLLNKALSSSGQSFLKTVEAAMEKLADEATSVALFEVMGQYFSDAQPGGAFCKEDGKCRDSKAALTQAEACMAGPDVAPELAAVLAAVPEQRKRLVAMLTLSFAGESLLDSFFSQSDTVGPLMRRKLVPWTTPMLEQIRCLRN